jgi:hypothetical protein
VGCRIAAPLARRAAGEGAGVPTSRRGRRRRAPARISTSGAGEGPYEKHVRNRRMCNIRRMRFTELADRQGAASRCLTGLVKGARRTLGEMETREGRASLAEPQMHRRPLANPTGMERSIFRDALTRRQPRLDQVGQVRDRGCATPLRHVQTQCGGVEARLAAGHGAVLHVGRAAVDRAGADSPRRRPVLRQGRHPSPCRRREASGREPIRRAAAARRATPQARHRAGAAGRRGRRRPLGRDALLWSERFGDKLDGGPRSRHAPRLARPRRAATPPRSAECVRTDALVPITGRRGFQPASCRSCTAASRPSTCRRGWNRAAPAVPT